MSQSQKSLAREFALLLVGTLLGAAASLSTTVVQMFTKRYEIRIQRRFDAVNEFSKAVNQACFEIEAADSEEAISNLAGLLAYDGSVDVPPHFLENLFKWQSTVSRNYATIRTQFVIVAAAFDEKPMPMTFSVRDATDTAKGEALRQKLVLARTTQERRAAVIEYMYALNASADHVTKSMRVVREDANKWIEEHAARIYPQ